MEASARALGEPPGNQRTIDSGRPTVVTDWATAPSTQLNQPQKGTLVRSLPHDRPVLQRNGQGREGDHSRVVHPGYARNHVMIA